MDYKQGWKAWYNRQPGPDAQPTVLHITNEFEFPTSGWTATLDYGNEGPYDDPDVTAFELTVVEPTGPVVDVLTKVPVVWGEPVVPDQKTARILTPDGPVDVTIEYLY